MKWDAELYDQKHAFVYQFGEGVLNVLDPKPGERILDIGCGTGHLTQRIQDAGAIVKGTDYSPDMIAKAKAKHPGVEFEVADAGNFYEGCKYNAIFSNAALHWVKDHDGLMDSVYKSLKPGGRFVAELGGKGNVDQFIKAVKKVLEAHGYHEQTKIRFWYFPSVGEYASRLEAHGFRVIFAIHFDRKTPLQDADQGVAKWIKMFGMQYFDGIPANETEQMLKEITALLEPDYNEGGTWYADYKRLRFIAIKECK